ncbi:hypothetical protein A2U01_0052261, partial [Trifolium medium]|nr:hypothetical protein [Trifolium medium]
QGVNVEQGVHEEEEHVEAAHADHQGLDDVMEEINRFESSAFPNQQQQSGDWPYTHSEHELASLLHNLNLNTHFRLPNMYYNTQGQLYTEAMTYRQQFPPAPFFPLYPSPEAWQEHRRVDRL